MADILIDVLSEETCTALQIRSALVNMPNVLVEINREISLNGVLDMTPLRLAIFLDKNVDIVKELLICGADVNPTVSGCNSPVYEAFNAIARGHLEYLKILVNNGANINGCYLNTYFQCLILKVIELRIELLLPTIQIMLPHGDKDTKTTMFYGVFRGATQYTTNHRYEDPHIRNIYIQVIKLILQSGADPTFEEFIMLLRIAMRKGSEYNSNMNLFLVVDLFEMIIPHFFVKRSLNEETIRRYNMDSDFRVSRMFSEMEKHKDLYKKAYVAKTLQESSITILNNCAEDCQKMESDTLSSNNSNVMLTLRNLMSGVETELTSETILDLMLRINKDEYPHFSDLMIHVLQSCKLREVYPLLLTYHLGHDYAVNPDIFYIITRFLSRKELFNLLMALIPKKFK